MWHLKNDRFIFFIMETMANSLSCSCIEKTGTTVTINWSYEHPVGVQYSEYGTFYFTWTDVVSSDGSKKWTAGPAKVTGLTNNSRYVFRITDGDKSSSVLDITTLTRDADYTRLLVLIPALEKEIQSRSEEIEALNATRSLATKTGSAEIERMIRERDSVQRELVSARSLIDDKLKILGEKQQIITDLQTKLKAIETLKKEISDLKTQLDEVRDQRDNLHAEITDTHRTYAELQRNFKLESGAKESALTLLDMKSHECDETKFVNDTLIKEAAEREEMLSMKNKELEDAAAKLTDSLKQQWMMFEKQLTAKAEELEAIRNASTKALSSLNLHIYDIENKLETALKDKSEFELLSYEKEEELTAIRNAASEATNSLRADIAELESQLGGALRQKSEIEDLRMMENKKQSEELSAILSAASEETNSLRSDVAELENKLAIALMQKSQLEELEDHWIMENKRQSEELSAVRSAASEATNSLRADVAELEKELAAARDLMLKATISLHERIYELENKLKSDDEEIARLISIKYKKDIELQQQSTVIASYAKDLSTIVELRDVNSSLKDSLEIAETDLKHAGEEIARLTALEYELNAKDKELQHQNAIIASHIVESTRMTDRHKEEIDSLEAEIAARDTKILTLEERLLDFGLEINELKYSEQCSKDAIEMLEYELSVAREREQDTAVKTLHEDNLNLMKEVARLKDLLVTTQKNHETRIFQINLQHAAALNKLRSKDDLKEFVFPAK